MHHPNRLFDVLAHQLEHFPKPDMLAAKVEGAWKTYATADVAALTARFAAGFLQLGVGGKPPGPEDQHKIAIISANRPEWILTDLACQQAGAVLVPIYPTISATELVFILNDSGAKLLFVDNAEMYDKVKILRDQIPQLTDIFSFDRIPGVRHWMDVPAAATPESEARLPEVRNAVSPGTLATIIYTSGTTGTPKGVMLTHGNIMSNVESCLPILPVDEHSRALSFLPLNHIFERMVTYVYFTAGVSVYYAESLDSIADNLREVQPGIFTTVPRVLEKLFEKIMAKGHALTGFQRTVFFWALRVGQQFEINKRQTPWYRLVLALANRLVFRKWREALGGNIRCIVTGAAACQVRLLKLFTAAGLPVLEGYGLTETSPVISVNGKDPKDRMFGTVGPVISNVEVKLADDGEILVKGPNVTTGYYKRPDLTAEAFHDGWFHTGDIGVMVSRKYLKITDRKKELFKTSGGKFVAPQPIENKFRESPFIEQIMVVGADRKFTGALIVPNFENLRAWTKDQGLAFPSNEAALNDPNVKTLYRDAVNRYNQYFNHIEQIKKFELMPREWTIDGGEMTPTLKLKRRVIQEKYRDTIERLYA
ncbi:AMP-dependent synthetase/ligase [Chitinophaga rhizosphaerae]|uniref:AMP-dependent synthetase/ligase n=1 Tax=Chitinophaga rhizosphaerae TaxID=1864947 RepID=UPI000F8000AB|nr:long-chain fatty acid--CoA ligase [Chitinophaga rhizosphaerae]